MTMDATGTGKGRRRVGVLISGRGSNMMALVEAARRPDFPAEIVLVLSNRRESQHKPSIIKRMQPVRPSIRPSMRRWPRRESISSPAPASCV